MNLNSYSKAQLVAMVVERDAQLLARGREIDAMRLEVSIATRNAPKPSAQAQVTMYRDRAGTLWVKTRIGTTARSRLATTDEERAYCTRSGVMA